MNDFKKYKRFFAFGCSMTQYNWPTWADILAKQIPESYNYGKSGAGNIYISAMVAEANMRYKFTKDDLVMVMWSTINREDRYYMHWQTHGNLYNQDFYSKDFVKNYVDHRGQLIRDFALISLTTGLLDNIGCDYHSMSMQPVTIGLADGYKYNDVIELYRPVINSITFNLLDHGCDGKWKNLVIRSKTPGGQTEDYHPSPSIHFKFIQKVFPNSEWSTETISFVDKADNEVLVTEFLEDLTFNRLPRPITL
jgi:hypothetical protein